MVISFGRKSKGNSPDMDLRGDYSYMSLGLILGYLDEHSHSLLLAYSIVYYLKGIAHCFSQVHYSCLSLIWILSYGIESIMDYSFDIWFSIGYLLVHMLLCWSSLGNCLYWAYSLDRSFIFL